VAANITAQIDGSGTAQVFACEGATTEKQCSDIHFI
jgi:hypothetical protein